MSLSRPNWFISLKRYEARFILAIVCALAMLVPTGHSFAQGTSGMLPDPISTRELDNYSRIIGLSEHQRQAIDPMHDQYLQQFQTLRESEIDQFLADARSLRRNMFNPTGLEDVKKATRDHKRIMSRIASLDDQLMNQIQTVLSEEQVPALTRARMARERERYTTDATRFATSANPGVRVDLSEIINSIELTPEEHQTIDPQVFSYERQLTGALKQLHTNASGMYERISETVAEAGGMPAEGERDPEAMREMFQVFRTAFEQAQGEVLVEAQKVSDLNRTTFKTLAPQLSFDHRSDFQRSYERRAYSSAFRRTGSADRRLNAALELDDLPSETKQAIEQLRVAFESKRSPIADQLMNLTDEQRQSRGGGGAFRFGDDDDVPAREKIDAQRDRLSALEDETIEQLNTILGTELVAALDGRGGERNVEGGRTEATFTFVGDGPGGAGGPMPGTTMTFTGTVELDDSPSDPYLPGPITRSDVKYYLAKLNVDDDRTAIVDSIYAQYMDGYQQVGEQYIEPLAESTREAFSFRRNRNEGEDRPPTTEADVTRLFEMRREAMNTILALDRTFFEDINLVVADGNGAADELKRCEQSRLRDVYNRGGGGGGNGRGNAFDFGGGGGGGARFNFGGGQEDRVDLTRAVRDLDFADSDAKANPILNSYGDTATDAFRRQYELSLQFGEATARVMAEAFQGGDDEQGRQQRFRMIGERMRELNETQGEQREQVEQSIVALNRQTVDELREALPEAIGRAVRDAYYKAAYPSVYEDRRSAQRQIDSAMQLPSLTAQQRTQLTDIAAEYYGDYDAMCLKMVEVEMQSTTQSSQRRDDRGGRGDRGDRGPGGVDWQRVQEQRNEMDRLRFSRNEMNEKARLRIRGVLNDEQQKQVPGLTDERNDG